MGKIKLLKEIRPFKIKNLNSFVKSISYITAYKIPILIMLLTIAFGAGALGVRGILLSKIKISKVTTPDILHLSNSLPVHTTASVPPIPSATPTEVNVLGVSTDSTVSNYIGGSSNLSFSPFPSPEISPTPLPTYTPLPVSTVPSVSSCSGTPNADNSQVYINSGSGWVTIAAGSSATITVDLQDCNNSKVSNDHLTITLTSGDSDTTIDGKSIGSGYKAQAQNGEYSFQVSSANATTAVFSIQDTDHNFAVTMPGYKNPQVTFTSGTSSGSNPNCTTASGVPNFWYSVFSPSVPINVSTSATITVTIKDCSNPPQPVGSDSLSVSLDSGDPSTQISSTSLTAQNGNASFTVVSHVATIAKLTIKDVKSNFSVTDANNNPLTITFTGDTSNSSDQSYSSPVSTSGTVGTGSTAGNSGIGSTAGNTGTGLTI